MIEGSDGSDDGSDLPAELLQLSLRRASRRPAGPLAPPTRRARRCSRWRSRSGGADAGRLARKSELRTRAAGSTPGGQGHGGFDKGTLAAARIGLKRACQEAARSRTSV